MLILVKRTKPPHYNREVVKYLHILSLFIGQHHTETEQRDIMVKLPNILYSEDKSYTAGFSVTSLSIMSLR